MRICLLRAAVVAFSVLALAFISLAPRSSHAGDQIGGNANDDYLRGQVDGRTIGMQQGVNSGRDAIAATTAAQQNADSGGDSGGGC